MRELIRTILNEVKFSQENADKLKHKFGWRFVQTANPKSGKNYKKLHIYTFRSPKYKYNVHIEEYEYDFYLISFFPKLNMDFYVKQSKLGSTGQKHYDEFTYLTKENIPLKILSLMISEKIEPEKILIRGAEKNIELTLTKNQENIIYNFHTEFWITKDGSIYDGNYLCGEIYLTILIDFKKNTYKIPKFKCKYDADICYQTENLSNSQEETNVVDVPKKDYSKYYKYGPIALGIGGIVATPFLLGVLGGKNNKSKRRKSKKRKTKTKKYFYK